MIKTTRPVSPVTISFFLVLTLLSLASEVLGQSNGNGYGYGYGDDEQAVTTVYAAGVLTVTNTKDVTIPEYGKVQSSTTVSRNLLITDVDVNINLTHTWDSDLDIYLLSPTGIRVELSTDNGGSGNNYTNTLFTDEASTSIVGNSAPFSGSYKPEKPLSQVDGQFTKGKWTLEITDDAEEDKGVLKEWSLIFTIQTDTDNDTYASLDADGTDCNDTNATIYPGAIELSDGLDNDCDGAIDEDITSTPPTSAPTSAPTSTPSSPSSASSSTTSSTPTSTSTSSAGTSPQETTQAPAPATDTQTEQKTVEATEEEAQQEERRENHPIQRTVKKVRGTKKGIRVEFSDHTKATVPVFSDKKGKQKTRVHVLDAQTAVVLSPNTKRLAVVNILSGKVLSEKIMTKIAYPHALFKQQTVHKKDVLMIVAQRTVEQFIALVEVHADGTITLHDTTVRTGTNILLKQTTFKKQTLVLKNAQQQVIARYLITRNLNIKKK